MSKHTATPWKGISDGRYDNSRNEWEVRDLSEDCGTSESAPITDSSGRVIAFVVASDNSGISTDELDANAAHIVRCVNNFDALAEALEKVVRFADSEPDGGDTVAIHRANIERARAALSAARSEP